MPLLRKASYASHLLRICFACFPWGITNQWTISLNCCLCDKTKLTGPNQTATRSLLSYNWNQYLSKGNYFTCVPLMTKCTDAYDNWFPLGSAHPGCSRFLVYKQDPFSFNLVLGVPRRSPIQVLIEPMLLNFSDRTRTGVFNMLWPLSWSLCLRRVSDGIEIRGSSFVMRRPCWSSSSPICRRKISLAYSCNKKFPNSH